MNRGLAVVGLGYGDEGKGTIVDYLVREKNAKIIVRFNGGSQAAHHVVLPDGRTHCFSQFGSGMFVPGVQTYLSHYMVVDPLAINMENKALKENGINDAINRLIVDSDCLVVTPFHKIIGRMLEIARGSKKHGSCGKGIGRAVEDGKILGAKALRIGDLLDARTMKEKLDFLWHVKVDLAEQIVGEHPGNRNLEEYLGKIKMPEYSELLAESYGEFAKSGLFIAGDAIRAEMLFSGGNTVFEGAQGVLLDTERGFLPYVTSTKTTVANAMELYRGQSAFRKIGVLRAYATRHGAGPFVTEDFQLTKNIPDMHNGNNEWQGPFRIGWMDLLAARYAVEINGGVDEIALTNLDRMDELDKIKVCQSYEYIGDKKDLLEKYFKVEKLANKRIKILGIRTEFKDEFSQKQLTRLLFDCRPLEFVEFQGWKKDLASARHFNDLPCEAKKFIDFIESSRGLNIPVSIISKGPTWADKLKTP